MAFYKECVCGEKLVFPDRASFPGYCPNCNRDLDNVPIRKEDDLQASQSTEGVSKGIVPDMDGSIDVPGIQKQRYALRLNNGKEIDIPSGGCIVGRTEVGAEELAGFTSVSRQHLKVKPRRSMGVIIEDISTYGTFVDGRQIDKNSPEVVFENSKVTRKRCWF